MFSEARLCFFSLQKRLINNRSHPRQLAIVVGISSHSRIAASRTLCIDAGELRMCENFYTRICESLAGLLLMMAVKEIVRLMEGWMLIHCNSLKFTAIQPHWSSPGGRIGRMLLVLQIRRDDDGQNRR